MKKFIFLLCLGVNSFTFGQNTISGTVTDQKNTPLFGVQIYIEQLHIGTTTDENGFFELSKIPNGNNYLIFSYIGFETQTKSLQLLNENKTFDIQLKETIFHMDEVIVSTPFQKIQSENVMKVEYKSMKSLEKTGAPTLIQGLVSIPGVSEISTGTGIGKPVIRGLSGNRVLVYAQGVRLENQQFGDEHGLGLNEAGIESVEVIKGPASLLYGSDALGGVLYFNPERFANNNETNASFSQNFFSNTLGSNSSLGFKTSKNHFKFLVRGTYNTHSDYKIPDGDRVTNTRFNEKDFKTGIGYNWDKFVTELRYNFTSSEIGITEGIENQTTTKEPNLPYQTIDNHILSLHNHFFLNNSKIDFNVGYVYNHRKEFEDEHDHGDEEVHEEHPEAALNLKLKTLTYEAKYHFPKVKKLETILGVQGLHQTNKNFGEEILIPDATTNDFGIFTTALFGWNENNNLQGGFRFDYRNLQTEEHIVMHEDEEHVFQALDKQYHNFTASLGYKTELFKLITTRLNLATGYRAPNLAELTSNGAHHGTNRFEIGNPDLKSEQNFQTDLSFEFRSEHFEVFANGFYNKINNYIFIQPTGEIEDDLQVFEYVQSDAKLYGGEFGLHFHPHPLDWLHLESTFETVIGEKNNGDYLPLIPANKWSNTLRTEFNGNKKFNDIYAALKLESFFEQNNVSQFETTTEGYNLLNLSTGATINFNKSDVRLNFSINNIFNTTYISHLSALKIDDIPNNGINFVLGLKWSI